MKRILTILLLLSSLVVSFAADYEEPSGGAQEGSDVGFGNITATSINLSGNVTLEDTTTSSTGIVFKGLTSFIHNFHHPTGGAAIPIGGNTFIGVDSGNFTMGSTASTTSHGSFNIGVGTRALKSVTIGYQNTGVGNEALSSNTSAAFNTALGYKALQANIVGTSNVGLGVQALEKANAYLNTAIGTRALGLATSGNTNTGIGYQVLGNITIGSNNIGLGNDAGYITSTSVANTQAVDSVFIGANSKSLGAAGDNEIVIGYNAIGNGSNTATIGNYSTTDTYIAGTARVAGGVIFSGMTSIGADYTLDDDIFFIECDATLGNISTTFSSYSTQKGRLLEIAKIDASGNGCYYASVGAETISGAASGVITTPYNVQRFIVGTLEWLKR
jgi:hypothetical protein